MILCVPRLLITLFRWVWWIKWFLLSKYVIWLPLELQIIMHTTSSFALIACNLAHCYWWENEQEEKYTHFMIRVGFLLKNIIPWNEQHIPAFGVLRSVHLFSNVACVKNTGLATCNCLLLNDTRTINFVWIILVYALCFD